MVKKPMLFQESFRSRRQRGILTPSLFAPPPSVLNRPINTFTGPEWWSQNVPENKHKLDSGSVNQHVATGKSLCPPSWSATHKPIGLLGLVSPPPCGRGPLDLPGSEQISLREAHLMTWLYFLHGAFPCICDPTCLLPALRTRRCI